MIFLIVVFLLLVSLKFTEQFALGCWGVGGYTLIFTLMIWHQLIEFKKDLSLFVCPFCVEGSLCQRFCKSVKIYTVVALFIAITIALSMISLLFLVDPFFYYLLFMDIFVFHYIFTHWNQTKSDQLKEGALKVYSEVMINVLNIVLLMLLLVALEFQMKQSLAMSPEVFGQIKEHVNHSCKVFQHILRTKEFLDISIFGLRTIEGVGNWLFGFFYISTLSLFPLLGITLVYKFALKMDQNITIKKEKKE